MVSLRAPRTLTEGSGTKVLAANHFCDFTIKLYTKTLFGQRLNTLTIRYLLDFLEKNLSKKVNYRYRLLGILDCANLAGFQHCHLTKCIGQIWPSSDHVEKLWQVSTTKTEQKALKQFQRSKDAGGIAFVVNTTSLRRPSPSWSPRPQPCTAGSATMKLGLPPATHVTTQYSQDVFM
jgi:hypothetical protein